MFRSKNHHGQSNEEQPQQKLDPAFGRAKKKAGDKIVWLQRTIYSHDRSHPGPRRCAARAWIRRSCPHTWVVLSTSIIHLQPLRNLELRRFGPRPDTRAFFRLNILSSRPSSNTFTRLAICRNEHLSSESFLPGSFFNNKHSLRTNWFLFFHDVLAWFLWRPGAPSRNVVEKQMSAEVPNVCHYKHLGITVNNWLQPQLGLSRQGKLYIKLIGKLHRCPGLPALAVFFLEDFIFSICSQVAYTSAVWSLGQDQ